MREFIRKLFQKDRYFFITFMAGNGLGSLTYQNQIMYAKNGMATDGLIEALRKEYGVSKVTILFIYPISKKEYLANAK